MEMYGVPPMISAVHVDGISDAGHPFHAFRRKRTEDEISFSVEIENRGVI